MFLLPYEMVCIEWILGCQLNSLLHKTRLDIIKSISHDITLNNNNIGLHLFTHGLKLHPQVGQLELGMLPTHRDVQMPLELLDLHMEAAAPP